jgi:hypothetical protein
MNSRSYFTNLISTDCTYPRGGGDYAATQPDDTPKLDDAPTPNDAPAVAKDKRRTRNFNVDEDKLQHVIRSVIVIRYGYCKRHPFRYLEWGCEYFLVLRWWMKCS